MLAEIYGYFFGKWNKFYRGGDTAGRKVHVQIMFPLKDKKCKVFEDIFSGT